MKKYPIAIIGSIIILIAFVCYKFFFVKNADNYVLKLDANSTTGYFWDYEMSDETIVQVVKDEYVEKANPDGLVGVGGTQVYEFKGLKEGTVTIMLRYKRNSAHDVADEKQIHLSVDKDLNVKKEKD